MVAFFILNVVPNLSCYFLFMCGGCFVHIYFDDAGKEHQHSDAALKAMSATAGRVAGLASIGFAKKESLEDSTADYMNALEKEVTAAAAAAAAEGTEVPTVGAVASALSAYLGNLENDMRSEKFRQVR